MKASLTALVILTLALSSFGADAYAIRATRVIKVGIGVQNLSVNAVATARSMHVPVATICVRPELVKAAWTLRGSGEAMMCQTCYHDGIEDTLFTLGLGPQRARIPAKSIPWERPMASFPLIDGRYVELNMSRDFQVWLNNTLYITHRGNVSSFRLALNGTTIRYYVA